MVQGYGLNKGLSLANGYIPDACREINMMGQMWKWREGDQLEAEALSQTKH